MKKISRILFVLFSVSLLQGATLNRPAPKFALMNSRHQEKTLTSYKGKVVFINFWASWCAPCQIELPELNRLAGDYKGKKVQVVAINVDQDRAEAQKLLTKLGLAHFDVEILWDTGSKTVSAYNIETMPTSFILDKQGTLRFTHSGFHSPDPATWRHEIDSLMTTGL